jgi:TIR domain-containing protein/pentapeptide repeat protein
LYGALLSRANLSLANLRGADLRETNLSNTNLHRTIVNEVKTHQTIFAQVDLREALGLTEIIHLGPSHVELYSVQFPQNGSTLYFLRGAGIPDEWIDFNHASMMRPIQYHSCFISYAHQDEMLARRLHADLQNQGVRCWFASEDMKIGEEIRKRIDEEIHIHDKLLLILSEHALASTWVKTEVEAALEKETRQQRSVLFPVRLDESIAQTSHAWAKQLRRARHIGDFTHWTDPRAYQQAFDGLLRDLKTEDDAKGKIDGKPGTP